MPYIGFEKVRGVPLSGGYPCVCLRAYFYATKICIRCRPSLYIFRSHQFFIFSIFADVKFKVSLLISLLYTPNKVLPSFCWNLHLTLVHCHTTKKEGEHRISVLILQILTGIIKYLSQLCSLHLRSQTIQLTDADPNKIRDINNELFYQIRQ